MQKNKLLLVEDDKNLGFVIQDNLLAKGFEVILCSDGELGWDTFQKENFDLCILDVMLPKKDGFSLAEQIRSKNEDIPILFLTAKVMQEDKIMGFVKGGDDYMTKPFNIEELLLRISVFLQRSRKEQSATSERYAIGRYTFDAAGLRLMIDGQERKLTQKEADILNLFCQEKGKILKREDILKKIWGDDDYFLGRSMDVFISKLRKYLKADSNIEIINYHGVGFQLEVNKNQS